MAEPLPGSLRRSLEAWEREAAAHWDRVSRSPEVLMRVGQQLNETLRAQQRITRALQSAAWNAAAARQPGDACDRLARLQARLDALSERLDRLEQRLDER